MRFFDAEMNQLASERAELEQALRLAIEHDNLEVYYQPILSDTSKLLGFEALARWSHPLKGPIPADIFIAVAEGSQLIVKLGEFVLNKACQQIKAWQQDTVSSEWTVAVNLSARQVQQVDFIQRFQAIVGNSGVRPECLVLEFTESLLQENINETIALIEVLSAQKFRFSLDDFGTGYSSLSYLKRLPIHFLKIDKSFVENIVEDKEDAAIVDMILTLATTIGKVVIAEGVENSAQFHCLKTLGCPRFQGFYLCEPMSAESITDWVKKHPLSTQETTYGYYPATLDS